MCSKVEVAGLCEHRERAVDVVDRYGVHQAAVREVGEGDSVSRASAQDSH